MHLRAASSLLAVALTAAAVGALASLPACGPLQDTAGSGAGGQGTGGGSGGTSGLPCDVAQVLQAHCLSCHGDPPIGGAPQSLNTYASLVATSAEDASQTFAERAVARMQDAGSPMPPPPATLATAGDVAVLQAWIDAGYPAGTCGATTSCATAAECPAGQACQDGVCIDPLNASPACTSGQSSLAHEGYDMAPGGACAACHRTKTFDAPIFAFAGTVFPTGHEPDDCIAGPVVASATIVIVDANGHEALELTPNIVGNFTSTTTIAMPYTAKLVYQGRERVMQTPQLSGDCNVCHTQTGANPFDPESPAPGRITLP